MAGVVDVFAGAGKVHELAGALQLGTGFELGLDPVLDALTSWLVVFSISLMAAASASLKLLDQPRASKCVHLAQRLEFGEAGID
jgi:hypothetical protein